MSFRKKLVLAQVIAFLLFFAALFPLIERMGVLLVKDSLIDSTSELKARLEKASSQTELIQSLKEQEYYAFFRISILDDQGLVIYDTHLGRQQSAEFKPYYPSVHKEVEEAKKRGIGYIIAKSDTFQGQFAYVAETFVFQGRTYILRTAFPYQQVLDLTRSFKVGVLLFSFVVLLAFNLLILYIFNRFTSPIREIIAHIRVAEIEGKETIPKITLSKAASPTDDFQRLATSFNQLSTGIQERIDALKSERNEKEAILESLGEGVVAVDEKMGVLYINAMACKMLGVLRASVLDKPFQGEGELLKKTRDLLREAREHGSIVIDSHVLGEEAKTFIDLIAVPKALGTGAIAVLQDKTEHYRYLEMGKDFIANASHELRTPITIIKGYAETLYDHPDLAKEKYEEITEKISRNCGRMESLIRSLLTLADIENVSEEQFRKTDLVSLLENCRHMVRSVYPDARITVDRPDGEVLILADRALLELAFHNLLDNAAKYSEAPAEIAVKLTRDSEDGVVVTLSDRGKGIPKEDLAHIFHRFYRVDKTHSRRLGGAGLGLSIVKTIIVKHRGKIEVESKVDEGTTFTIALPVD